MNNPYQHHIYNINNFRPVFELGSSLWTVGFPASAQYAQVILNNPQTSPPHCNDRLQLEIASQIHPKHQLESGDTLIGGVCAATTTTKQNSLDSTIEEKKRTSMKKKIHLPWDKFHETYSKKIDETKTLNLFIFRVRDLQKKKTRNFFSRHHEY